MAEAGRYGTLHWGPAPAGLDDLDNAGDAAPPTALGTGVAAPLAGMEKNYEQASGWLANKIAPYTSFPNTPNWGLLAGWSPVAGIIPRSLPELMVLGAAGGTTALQEALLPEAAIDQAGYGIRAARNALRPVVPAVTGGIAAGLTGQNVPNNMAFGAGTGMVGAVENIFARRAIGAESSPYIRQFLARQGRDLATSLRTTMPNLFSGLQLNGAEDMMTIFSRPFNKLPWVQTLNARYAGRTMPHQVVNMLKNRLEEYNILGQFFQNPDNYSEDGRLINPLKLKQWIVENGAKIPERMIDTLDGMIRAAYGLGPNDPVKLSGLDIMPEAGRLGARLHTVPSSDSKLTPLNLIMHYGFGRLGKFVGKTLPELTPAWWKELATQMLANRVIFGEGEDFPDATNTSMPEAPTGKTPRAIPNAAATPTPTSSP